MKENILLLSACDSLNQKVLSESLSVQTRVFRVRVLRVFRSTLRSARVCGRKSAFVKMVRDKKVVYKNV